IKIAESTAPATVRFGYGWARLLPQLLEGTIAQGPKDGARRLVCVLRQLALDFRVDVAGHHEDIGVTVVVEIDDAGSPADVARFHGNASRAGHIVKISFPVVVVEAVGIFGEVGLEEI